MKGILLIFFLILSATLYAQHKHEPCATMEQDSISRARFPERGSLDDFEHTIQLKIQEIQKRQANGRTQGTVVTIPIIVHVVHNGEAIGSGTNISQAQVQAQIEVLNEDFRKKIGTPGYNTNPAGADIEIEFCLSPVDENGNALIEPGIHRYDGNRADWSRDQIESTLKPSTIWNTNFFYNIWTVKFAAVDATLIGYAQFPDNSGLAGLPTSGPAKTDGVVVRYQSFGSTDKGTFPVMEAPYNKGRTLTHETGHWLGLRHIWGDGVCADDFVADTPTQRNASSGCPNTLACNNATPAMVQNYMDYSNDACMNIFTQGQKTRMLAVMEVSPRRKTLIEGNLCSPQVAEVPTANFTVDNQLVLLGGEANFSDLSTNFPNQWLWTFEGGEPSTSTIRNPTVLYSSPGVYKVTLIATNTIGASAPLERINYITVSEEGLCNAVSNFDESFTPSKIKLSDYGSYTGYLTGHNSLKSKAISEYFTNSLGYQYISGVNIKFNNVYTTREDATVTVTVWNARGPQNAPGAVIERKVVLLKQIADDITNGVATSITFDRETPVFRKPFQVGIELDYTSGDSIAIESSADGEAVTATSWIQNKEGVWSPYSIAFGANIAMNIEPLIGMNPSVQVSASKLLIYPGEQITLNGKGASIFSWAADDGSIENVLGPQLIVNPVATTTYITTGAGLDLCNETATTTIYVRENTVDAETEILAKTFLLYPNPGLNQLTVQLNNSIQGTATIEIQNVLGEALVHTQQSKNRQTWQTTLDTENLRPGVYLIQVKLNKTSVIKKWIKL